MTIAVPAAVVVDASVAVKWVIDEVGSDRVALLRNTRLFAPDLWVAECANYFANVGYLPLNRDVL